MLKEDGIGNALQAAPAGGYGKVVEVPLRKRADTNDEGDFGMAVHCGQYDTVVAKK